MKNSFLKKVIALALAAAMAVAPAGAVSVDAKSSIPTEKKATGLYPETALYDMDADSYTVQVEIGSSFYMGDIVMASIKYSNGMEYSRYLTGLGATYKTSKAAVAAVDGSTGVVTPKSKGTAKVTVKYKDQKAVVAVKVVAKNTFDKAGSKAKSAAKKLAKYSKSFKGTFNEKNAKKMIAAAKKCKAVVMPYYSEDYTGERYAVEYGFGAEETTAEDGSSFAVQTNELIYPGSVHYHAMDQIIGTEIYVKYNPFVRTSKDPVIIKKAVASEGQNKVVLTLSRKITDLEYAMLSYSGGYIVNNKPCVNFYTVADDEPGYMVWTDGGIKKNSNKITAEMTSAYDKDFNYYYPDDESASAAKKELAAKLVTFRSGVSYNFYTDATFNESGELEYAPKKESWTNNYKLTVE